MINRTMFLLFALFALAVIPFEPGYAEGYRKLDGSGPTVWLLNSPARIGVGDVVDVGESCTNSEGFCLRGDGFTLMIPFGKEAHFSDGSSAREIKRFRTRLLGENVDIRLIEAIVRDAIYTYQYSPEVGLQGFSLTTNGETATFLSMERKGFRIDIK